MEQNKKNKNPFEIFSKFFFPKNIFLALVSGLVWAGIFSGVFYVVAADRAEPYGLGETLDPTCNPDTDANCTVVEPAAYTFDSNTFTGIGNFYITDVGGGFHNKADNSKHYFGESDNASIYYNGSN
jgi:hypothetical protein